MAAEYAKALFDLCADETQREDLLEELRQACDTLSAGDGMKFLSSPAVPAREREKTVLGAFEGRVSALCARTLAVLCKNGHMRVLPDCVQAFEALLLEEKGIAAAEVTSAVPLDDAQRKRLCEALEKRTGLTIRLQEKVDPAIMGGLIIRMGDKQWDGSIREKLHTLKEVMLNGAEN